ncbi:hypothetical protein ACHAWF_010615 [Thalassiosira exigua]
MRIFRALGLVFIVAMALVAHYFYLLSYLNRSTKAKELDGTWVQRDNTTSALSTSSSIHRNVTSKNLISVNGNAASNDCPHPMVPLKKLGFKNETEPKTSSRSGLSPQQVYDAYKSYIDGKIDALPTYGRPCTQQKLFRGEFGYEIQGIVPWYYDTHITQKCDLHVEGVIGSRYLHWFASSFEQRNVGRKAAHLPPDGPVRNVHRRRLPEKNWTMPPWRDFFGGELDTDAVFPSGKPIAMVFNKYVMEWGRPPINFLDVATLRRLFSIVSLLYQIVYVQMEVSSLEDEGYRERNRPFNDKGMIRSEHPEVVLFEDVYDNATMDYNLLLFGIASKSDLFVSVQGGVSVVASLWKAPNFIYASRGHELEFNTYHTWYERLGSDMVRAFNYKDELLETLRIYVRCGMELENGTIVPYTPTATKLLRWGQINHTRNQEWTLG